MSDTDAMVDELKRAKMSVYDAMAFALEQIEADRRRIVAGLNRAFHDATDASMRNALSRAIEIVRGEI